jgi:hypothetical protein
MMRVRFDVYEAVICNPIASIPKFNRDIWIKWRFKYHV